MKLFLSYARADLPHVKPLEAALQACPGVGEVFFDQSAIKAGQDWRARILAGVRDADAMVVAASTSWIISAWCRREIEYADRHGVPVIPVYLKPLPNPDQQPILARQSIRHRGGPVVTGKTVPADGVYAAAAGAAGEAARLTGIRPRPDRARHAAAFRTAHAILGLGRSISDLHPFLRAARLDLALGRDLDASWDTVVDALLDIVDLAEWEAPFRSTIERLAAAVPDLSPALAQAFPALSATLPAGPGIPVLRVRLAIDAGRCLPDASQWIAGPGLRPELVPAPAADRRARLASRSIEDVVGVLAGDGLSGRDGRAAVLQVAMPHDVNGAGIPANKGGQIAKAFRAVTLWPVTDAGPVPGRGPPPDNIIDAPRLGGSGFVRCCCKHELDDMDDGVGALAPPQLHSDVRARHRVHYASWLHDTVDVDHALPGPLLLAALLDHLGALQREGRCPQLLWTDARYLQSIPAVSP